MADYGNPELSGEAWSRELGEDVQPQAPKFAVGQTVSLGGNRRSRITERNLGDGGTWSYFTPAFGWQKENKLQADSVKVNLVDRPKVKLDDIKPANDPVNHPSHYMGFSNGAEVIDIVENLNFNRGNAVKYLARAGQKDPAKEVEDIRKAIWYANRELKRLGVEE